MITHYNCYCIISHIIQPSTETYRLSSPIQLPPCPPTLLSNVPQTRGSSHAAIWFNDHLKRQAMATKTPTEQMDDCPANAGFYTQDDVTSNGQTGHACQSPITESRRAIQELVTKAQSKNAVTGWNERYYSGSQGPNQLAHTLPCLRLASSTTRSQGANLPSDAVLYTIATTTNKTTNSKSWKYQVPEIQVKHHA
jgi:hypothetical protein